MVSDLDARLPLTAARYVSRAVGVPVLIPCTVWDSQRPLVGPLTDAGRGAALGTACWLALDGSPDLLLPADDGAIAVAQQYMSLRLALIARKGQWETAKPTALQAEILTNLAARLPLWDAAPVQAERALQKLIKRADTLDAGGLVLVDVCLAVLLRGQSAAAFW